MGLGKAEGGGFKEGISLGHAVGTEAGTSIAALKVEMNYVVRISPMMQNATFLLFDTKTFIYHIHCPNLPAPHSHLRRYNLSLFRNILNLHLKTKNFAKMGKENFHQPAQDSQFPWYLL